MRGVWIVWALAWVALALPGSSERSTRPIIANASGAQALTVAGVAMLAGLGPGDGGKPAPALAVALVVVLLIGATVARLSLGSDWSADIREPREVKREGPFALAGGHPIYAFVSAAAMVTALATRSPRDGVGAAMIASGVWWKAGVEDAALAGIKGDNNVISMADYRK